MSEFIAKIKAELDSKEVEQKLDELTKGKKKVKLEVDDSNIDNIAKKTDKLKDKNIKLKTDVSGSEKIDNVSKSLSEAEKSVGSFNNSVKGLAKLGAYINVFQEIERGAKAAVKAVEEIDKSIVDLQMATGDSYANVKNMVSGYNDFAKQLGATTTEVSAGASDWLRQGKSIAETNKLIQDSMVLSKVANIGSEDSTKYLTAMMKGYHKSAEEVSAINDSLTSIDLAAAVDAGGLAEATSRVAATADQAGVSLNKLLGYEAAVGEASQETMSVIGNSFKTIFSRMADIKADKLELIDEDGTVETISDVETVLKNVGIELRSSINEFRDFDEVLDELAMKWKKLPSVRRGDIAKAFAGQRQSNRFRLLMDNYDTALAYEKIANESSGTAMQKFNDAYLNSIEAKQKSLQASFENLSVDLISRDSINGILEATQILVEFLDKTNLLKGALTGLAAGGMMKGFAELTNSITQAAMKMQNFQQALSLLKAGNIGESGIQKLSALVDGLSESQLKAVLSSEQLSTAQRLSILTSSGMSQAQATATLSTMGLSTAEGAATASTLSFGSALKGLWATLLANPIVLISTALSAGISIWSSYKQGIEESIQKATDSTTAWKESSNALNEQISKYKELKQQLDSGALTPTEEYQTRQQILDIQSQITSQYGDQVTGIDLVNGSLQTQLGLLQQISAENAKKQLNESRKEYQDAEKEMTKERNYNLGFVKISDKKSLDKDIKDIARSFEDVGISLTTMGAGGGNFNILFKGDASQAEESINGFMNKIDELKSKYTDEDSINFLDKILDQSGKSLSENKDDVLSKYQDNYKSFLQMDMLSQGTGKGSVSDTFDQYTESIQKYNEALAGGDTGKIIEARSEFASLGSQVDSLLSKDSNDKFSLLFDEVTDQLNEASVKVFDFQEALSGKKNVKNQFKETSEDIQKAGNNLKRLKLDVEEVREALITSGKQKGETAIQTLAKAWGLDAESSAEEIYAFTDALTQAGIISGQVSGEIEDATSSFNAYSTSVEKAKENLDKLREVMSQSVSGEGISADNVKAFKEIFGADAEKALERTTNGYHVNKKALAELQVQLDAMTKSDYLSALSDQYTELQNIEGKIAAAELLGQDTSGLEASKSRILDNISHLQDLQFQYEATTSAYQQWQLAMSGGEEGDMYDSIVGSMKSVEEDLYNKGLTGTNAFREFTDLVSNKDLSNATNEEIVAAYEESIPIVKRYFTEGQEGAQNFLADIQNINSEWAHMNEDGSWDINFGIGQDQAIADALKMDVEAVQIAMRKLSDFGFDINLDEPIASLEELRTKAESASETLSGLGDDVKIDLDVNSFEGVDKQISSMKKYIGEVESSDIDLNIKSDKLESANSILEYLVAKKKELGESEGVDIAINIDESQIQAAFETLARLKSDLENIQGKVGVETSGLQTDINNCVAEIEKMSPEMKVALGIQDMSIEEIKAGLLDGTIEIPAKVEVDTAEANKNIDEVKKNNIKDKNFDVKANTTQAKSELASVKSFLSGITGKTITVTVNKVTNEIVNKSSSPGSSIGNTVSSGIDYLKNRRGAINGTAHVKGTAYSRGNWGNPVTQKALVGELGTEIIVDPHTGTWYTVGDNGAEFIEVPKNAIVFNHLQSESLLKNGYAIGRGTALASGTAFSDGYGKFNVGNSGSNAYSSSSNSNSNDSNSKNNSDSANDSAEEFKETLDGIEILINRIERDIKNIERVAGSAYNTFAKRNNALRNQISSIYEEISIQQQGYNRYLQEAESVPLSEEYKNLVRNGAIDISTITDKDLSENINKYKEWYEKALDCRDAIEELTESVRDLYKQAFDNVVTMYEGMLSQIEHRHNMLEGYIDQTEAQGYIVSTKYYDAMITNEQNKLSKLNKERNDLINAMNDAIVNGDIEVESEAWYDMQASINGVNEAIQESTTNIIEFKNAIREIEWSVFDKIQDRISSITTEADFLKDLISDEKMYDDDGKVTKHGTATYGLHGVNYNVYMSQADQYRKEMESIQKELSKDPYNETLIERRKELLELQQESILAAEEEKEAIKNLVQEGIEKQLEALEKLIDKYLEAIDSQKEMHDFQKDISKKQKEIDSLRKQLTAYAGDDSEEGSVKKQQTENKLKEAEENLEESLYDKAISDQKKLLDELYSEYETILNMRLDNIDVLISEVIANINSDASEIRDTLVSEAEKVGYKLTDSMNTIWGTNGTIANILTTYSSNFSSTMTTVQTAINGIKIAIQNAIAASNKTATSNISSIDKQQSQQTSVSKPTTSKPVNTTPKPPVQSNSGGDGVPRIGDKVTYVSGSYFYSSDGLNPSGNQMLGQQVYITNINNASWAQKPYHISRTSRLGEQDLGWVNLNQLSGYKTGKFMIDRDQLGITQEEGNEIILGRSDGAMLMPNEKGQLTSLKRGDAVVDADGTNNLLSFANNPDGYLQRMINKVKSDDYSMKGEVVGGQTQNEININVELENVRDYNDFLIQMQHDPKFERMIQAMSIDRIAGKSGLDKYKVIFR